MFVPKLNFRTQLFCKPMCPYPGLIFSLNSLSYQTLIASPSYSKHPQFVNLLAPRAEFGNHMGCFLTSSGKSSMCIFFLWPSSHCSFAVGDVVYIVEASMISMGVVATWEKGWKMEDHQNAVISGTHEDQSSFSPDIDTLTFCLVIRSDSR